MIRPRASVGPEDIAGHGGSGPDGQVNVSDLLAVNNNWCGESTSAPCCSGCPVSFGPAEGPLSLEEMIALVYESDQPGEVQAVIIEQILEAW